MSPVPVQMGSGVSPVPVQMWQRRAPVPAQMWSGASPPTPRKARVYLWTRQVLEQRIRLPKASRRVACENGHSARQLTAAYVCVRPTCGFHGQGTIPAGLVGNAHSTHRTCWLPHTGEERWKSVENSIAMRGVASSLEARAIVLARHAVNTAARRGVASPVLAQMWPGRADSLRRCGRGEPSPGTLGLPCCAGIPVG
jgi:hypothetical protein